MLGRRFAWPSFHNQTGNQTSPENGGKNEPQKSAYLLKVMSVVSNHSKIKRNTMYREDLCCPFLLNHLKQTSLDPKTMKHEACFSPKNMGKITNNTQINEQLVGVPMFASICIQKNHS